MWLKTLGNNFLGLEFVAVVCFHRPQIFLFLPT